MMVLPYTPGQLALRSNEETDEIEESIGGMPVVLCTVHSQVAPVCAGLGEGLQVAYIQVAGGALPVSLSDTVRLLKERRMLTVACAVSPCLDGDAQFVTAAAALAWAKAQGNDVAVCSVGPGIVGTGSRLGHGALALADVANAAFSLRGRPVLAIRTSDGGRARSAPRGLAPCADGHATSASLSSKWPEEGDDDGWEQACADLPLSHMGRGPAEDPVFFGAAYAAGVAARKLLR